MSTPSRRRILASSAGLTLAALSADQTHAAAAPPGVAPTPTAKSPRETLRLDFGWRFRLGHASDPGRDFGFGADQSTFAKAGSWNWPQAPVSPYYNDTDWKPVDLPHDWAIELPFVQPAYLDPNRDDQRASHGYKPLGREYPDTSVGWYRHVFALPPGDAGRRLSLEFEGVFRDCRVWVNGYLLTRSASGYAPFRVDFTDVANIGGQNVVTLRVDASEGEGWFYEGAGVYRHVWLVKTDPLHVPQWGTFIRSTVNGLGAAVALTTEVANDSDTARDCEIVSTVYDPAGKPVAMARGPLSVPPRTIASLDQQAQLAKPSLWAIETPVLYRLDTEVVAAGLTVDRYSTTFGIRTFRFDPDQGVFLNGAHVKIKGTCNHQDHAGVGVAIPDRLQAWRIERLKAMGSNAYRTSHNPPAPSLLDACDRLGMLVLDEARRMGSDPEALAELEAMIRRDRNRPSVFLWCIGNEEPQEVTAAGGHIAETMKRLVNRLDGTRLITEAMDFGWGSPVGVSNVIDVMGFNYRPAAAAAYHAKFPTKPIILTETGSTVTTRGVYTRDVAHQFASAYDVEAPPWAQTAEQWWPVCDAAPYSAGGFVWTGFDYRGEPTPFHKWPSVASYFGLMDSCGFAKDEFYYYKAWWDPAPMLHLFPHWTWPGREGKAIDVWCYANVERVELFLNGKSLGAQPVVKDGHLAWSVPYAPGALEAHGYVGDKLVVRERRETAGDPAKIALTADRTRLAADNADLAVVTIAILDAHGRPVPDAANAVQLTVRGPGDLIGMGNGDPTSHEPDKTDIRRAFKGLAMGLVQASGQAGRIRVRAEAEGLDTAELVLTTG
jgi:beta-galactosidase